MWERQQRKYLFSRIWECYLSWILGIPVNENMIPHSNFRIHIKPKCLQRNRPSRRRLNKIIYKAILKVPKPITSRPNKRSKLTTLTSLNNHIRVWVVKTTIETQIKVTDVTIVRQLSNLQTVRKTSNLKARHQTHQRVGVKWCIRARVFQFANGDMGLFFIKLRCRAYPFMKKSRVCFSSFRHRSPF